MLSSIIQNIAKPFSKSQVNQTRNCNTENGTTAGRDDRVEDGFLLVGDTASERTIVNARNFNAETVDAPPNYRDVETVDAPPNYRDVLVNCLPSHQEYTSNMFDQSPTLHVSQFPGIQHGNPFSTGSPTVITGRQAGEQQQSSSLAQGFTDGISGRTAISDVPFVLGNSLQFLSSVHEMHSSNIFQQKSFDYSLYDYDFNLERSFLNEHEICRENDGMEFLTKNYVLSI